MRAYFVSDIHIHDSHDDKAKLFYAFLKTLPAQGATHLFLVGDIFDLWIASHKYFRQQYQLIIQAIEELVQKGIEVHYFEGNHDLYLKSFWPNVGVVVHEDGENFALAGKIIRVEHGDLYDPMDSGYIFLRWFLRTWFMKLLAPRLPEAFVLWLGQRSSRVSRHYTTHLKKINTDQAIAKLRAHALKEVATRDFDLLINGHVHVRDEYNFEWNNRPRQAVNLGSWFDSPKVYLLSDDQQGFLSLP